MEKLGLLFQTIGEVVLALTVIIVHYRLQKERKVDNLVSRSIHLEQIMGILAIVLIVIGFVFQVIV